MSNTNDEGGRREWKETLITSRKESLEINKGVYFRSQWEWEESEREERKNERKTKSECYEWKDRE